MSSANENVMASFDETNLFTNVPLDKTINIIMNSLFDNSKRVWLKSESFYKADEFRYQGYFFCNNKLYMQWVALSVQHWQVWLNNCRSDFKPVHYLRYVENTLLLFTSQEHINKFLEYLNNKYPNIKFTCDIVSNVSLPFLDVNISRNKSPFETSLFRKPTYTGLTTKFDSYIQTKYKEILISTLIY